MARIHVAVSGGVEQLQMALEISQQTLNYEMDTTAALFFILVNKKSSRINHETMQVSNQYHILQGDNSKQLWIMVINKQEKLSTDHCGSQENWCWSTMANIIQWYEILLHSLAPHLLLSAISLLTMFLFDLKCLPLGTFLPPSKNEKGIHLTSGHHCKSICNTLHVFVCECMHVCHVCMWMCLCVVWTKNPTWERIIQIPFLHSIHFHYLWCHPNK